MALPSIKFKKMLSQLTQMDRFTVLSRLGRWLNTQTEVDPRASQLSGWFSNLESMNNMPDKDFKNPLGNWWLMGSAFDMCVSFQQIVKNKLAVPKENIAAIIKNVDSKPRKSIPKKVRGAVWSNQFGESTKGSCYCCKKEFGAFDDWHAGHVISHNNGGSDKAENLRPICGSCNLSMGTENMDEFKTRCYTN